MSAEANPAPPGSNFLQKLIHYAPLPKEVLPNLWKSAHDAPKDISEMQPGDILKYGEEAISTNSGNKELRILVTGKTGQGKSTLINGLLGASFAREGAGAARCTTEVEVFKKEINGVPVVVYDSPGLQDNTSNEEEYIKSMKETCQKLSLVLYCTKMTNTRLGDDDKKAMKKLTQAFGQGFWNHAVFVLTFANMERVDRKDDRDEPSADPPIHFKAAWESLMKRRFEGRVQIWKEELHKFLINEVKVKSSIANGVPVIPTGDHVETYNNPNPLRLPDRESWFQVLWETCSFQIREQGLFLEINSHRMSVVDEGDDDGGQQEMNACQGDDQPREIENYVGKEISTVNVLPDSVRCNVEVRESRFETQTSEKLETKEQSQRPKYSRKELRKSTDRWFSLQLDDVNISSQHEPNKSPSKPPQPPPKPRHLRPLQNEVERRPRSAAFSMRDKNELQSKLSVRGFCEENHSSLRSQESTLSHQESTKENIAYEDSSKKYDEAVSTLDDEIIVCEVAPEDDEDDYIQVCEAPNENTPCEDKDINPKENDSNETAIVKVGIEANGSFNGLQNQPVYITNKYATEASINAVEKRFGRPIAEAFRAALKYVKKPGQWFVKVFKKKNQKSIKSN